jgi:lysozyme
MKVSEDGIRLIAKHEGFRSKPYLDAVGVPTIGYGNTFYPDNARVTIYDKEITQERGRELLRIIISGFERDVLKVMRAVNQNQFDAVLSFVYNLGMRNFKNSTLLERINNNPNDPNIAFQFSQWNKARDRKTNKLIVLAGLTRRRKEESTLYFK